MLNTYIIRRNEPGHLGAGGELTVDQALDLTLGPAVVDVHDGDHVPLARLKLVLDAVLETLALDLHRRQHEAVADEVGRIADTLGRFEAVGKTCVEGTVEMRGAKAAETYQYR